MDSAADPLRNFIHAAAKLVLKMFALVVQLSPYAAFFHMPFSAYCLGYCNDKANIAFAVIEKIGEIYKKESEVRRIRSRQEIGDTTREISKISKRT